MGENAFYESQSKVVNFLVNFIEKKTGFNSIFSSTVFQNLHSAKAPPTSVGIHVELDDVRYPKYQPYSLFTNVKHDFIITKSNTVK